MWYCDICEKEIDIITKSKHIKSETHIHRREYGIVVKKYKIIQPEIGEIDYLLRDVFKNCGENVFHTFEYRCMYDIKFTNTLNGEVFYFTIINEFMRFKSEFYGLNKKNLEI